MAFNHTHSAILRGRWLVNKAWADAHMPLVFRLLQGEAVDFGGSKMYDDDRDDEEAEEKRTLPVLEHKIAGRNVYGVSPYTNIASLPGESIVMITLSGPLLKNGGMCSYGMVDHTRVANQLSTANNVAGVIYNIDSPGGQASGTAMLGEAIKNLAAQKPVIVHINDGMAASAAMWIASAANEIYVSQKTDQVGSIGVYTSIADWQGHYKEYFKLNVQDIYAPQSTEKNKDYRDAISGDTSAVEQDLAVLADQFINTVAANRPNLKGTSWKTGKMFYADEAKKIGLIDGIKSFGEVVKRLDSLISSRNKSQSLKSMAFEKTITAAKAESFGVVEGGFLLEENHLNNIETALDAVDASQAALETANASLATATEQLNSLKADNETLTAANATQAGKIVALEAKVTELGKKPSGKGTALTTTKDESAEDDQVPVYLNDASPENEWFDKQAKYR